MRISRAWSAALLGILTASCGGSPSAPSSVAPAPTPSSASTQELRGGGIVVLFQPADAAWAPIVHSDGVAGRENARHFFGAPTAGEIRIDVFPDRAALTAHWARIWRSPGLQTECWMVAAGDAAGVSLLSPGAWARDACGQDGQDALYRGRVTSHEVVHVHHARANPSWAATAQGLGWFTEGLAVHASGQLVEEWRALVRGETLAGRAPARLSEVLPAGYDWAGSLVAFIDRRYGRAVLVDLLVETQEVDVLRRLDTSEAALLRAWQTDVRDGR